LSWLVVAITDNKEVVITMNKIASNSDLNTIEKYMKELNDIYLNEFISLKSFQSKSYLKILGILYFIEDTNLLITTDIIERVIKTTYIFNDTVLAFYSQIIKIFPKSDITMVWVNIWNSQNDTKAKSLINRSFNISCHCHN